MSPALSASRVRFGPLVFAVVVAAFTNLYVTQPVLPVLAQALGPTPGVVSITVSAVVMGIAVANVPWGIWADRHRIGGILAVGGTLVGAARLAGYFATGLEWLAVTRFVQGLALPAMLTCMVAYLGRVLSAQRLNLAMGAYVSATVVGGWLFPEAAWREAMLVAALLAMVAVWIAAARLPDAG